MAENQLLLARSFRRSQRGTPGSGTPARFGLRCARGNPPCVGEEGVGGTSEAGSALQGWRTEPSALGHATSSSDALCQEWGRDHRMAPELGVSAGGERHLLLSVMQPLLLAKCKRRTLRPPCGGGGSKRFRPPPGIPPEGPDRWSPGSEAGAAASPGRGEGGGGAQEVLALSQLGRLLFSAAEFRSWQNGLSAEPGSAGGSKCTRPPSFVEALHRPPWASAQRVPLLVSEGFERLPLRSPSPSPF